MTTATRELALARRALRTAATHLAQARWLGGPMPAEVRDATERIGAHLWQVSLQLNASIQDVNAMTAARRRARREGLTPPRGP